MKKLFDILTALVILNAAFYISGCSSYKKQLVKFHLFAYQHPDELAKDCAKQFPVTDSLVKGQETSTSDSTVTITALFSTDTSVVKHFTKAAADSAIKKGCPVITKTINHYKTTHDTVIRRDNARIDTLSNFIRQQRSVIDKDDQKLEDLKKLSNQRLMIMLALGIVVIALGGYTIHKWLFP